MAANVLAAIERFVSHLGTAIDAIRFRMYRDNLTFESLVFD